VYDGAVRILGILLAVLGAAGTALSVRGALSRPRPVDVAFALAAPCAVALALLGLVLAFVPGFLG
jgi:hypothetical protein